MRKNTGGFGKEGLEEDGGEEPDDVEWDGDECFRCVLEVACTFVCESIIAQEVEDVCELEDEAFFAE